MNNQRYRRLLPRDRQERVAEKNEEGQIGVAVTQEANGYGVWKLTYHCDGPEENFVVMYSHQEDAIEHAVYIWEKLCEEQSLPVIGRLRGRI